MNARNCVRKNKKGNSLLFITIFTFLTSFSVGGIMMFLGNMHSLSERSLALEKAEMTAEAGNYQLLQFFNHPDDIGAIQDPNNYNDRITNLYNKMIENGDANGGQSANDIGGLAMVFVDQSRNTDLINLNGGKVIDLEVLYPPRNGAPSNAVCTFKSTAEVILQDGAKVKRTAFMDVNFAANGKKSSTPAGLISGGKISGNGKLNVNWGPVWSKDNINLLLNRKSGSDANHWSTAADNVVIGTDDHWIQYISAKGIYDTTGSKALVPSSSITDVGNYGPIKYHPDGQSLLYQFDTQVSDNINKVLTQYTSTSGSDAGYYYWKNLAISRDTYYRVTSKGNVVDENGAQLYSNANDAINAYRKASDEGKISIAFFDTKDGNKPNDYAPPDSRSNWANISYSGTVSNCSKGILYVAGALTIGGSGTANPTELVNPDGTKTILTNVFHNGIMFTYGDFNLQSSTILYGAVITNGQFKCSGNPKIYYNEKCKSGETIESSGKAVAIASYIPSGVN